MPSKDLILPLSYWADKCWLMTKYSDELGRRICDAIAGHKSGLRSLCDANPDFPTPETICGWRLKHDSFGQWYSEARQRQILMMAEDIVDISDDLALEPNDKRLRVETRKWLLAKLVANIYGDKLDVTSAGQALAPPSHQIDARVQSILMQVAQRRAQRATDETLDISPEALKLLG